MERWLDTEIGQLPVRNLCYTSCGVLAGKRNRSVTCAQSLLHELWSAGWKGSKEGNVLFNDALNTFYLRLYGVRHMVKDHSDSEKGNLLLPHRLLFPINNKGSFICTIPQTG